jgi:hypothetical protein
VPNLSQAAIGAVEASFGDIADGLLDTESLIEAAYMAASSIEEDAQQSAMKRLLDVIQGKTREIRKAFENKHGNPIYRQKAVEQAKSEEAAKRRHDTKEAQPTEDDPAAPTTATSLLRVYDTLTLTKGLFEAASDVSDKRIPLEHRGAMDAAIYALQEKVSEAEDRLMDIVEELKADQTRGR